MFVNMYAPLSLNVTVTFDLETLNSIGVNSMEDSKIIKYIVLNIIQNYFALFKK